MAALLLSEAADRRRQEQANTFNGDLRAMMRDIRIRLEDGFTLTQDQKVSLRSSSYKSIYMRL